MDVATIYINCLPAGGPRVVEDTQQGDKSRYRFDSF